MKKFATTILSIAMIIGAMTGAAMATTTVKSNPRVAAAAKTKPRVVIIRADWCSACQKLDPTMMGLMQEYGNKLDFVMLDVSNEATTAQAAAKAKSLGLSSYFEANKKNTSTVAIFKGKKSVFKTMKNFNKADYVAAFDKALK
jgi:thiol-disulfide isomerase/thioredoxin